MRRIREQLDRPELAQLWEPSARRLTVAQLAAVILLAMSLVVANPTIRALGVADGGSRDNADLLFVAPGSARR